jgi:hypothetical protein
VNFKGKKTLFNEIFVTNKLGYLILAQIEIYPLNLLTGRAWCVVVFPSFVCKSILVITR